MKVKDLPYYVKFIFSSDDDDCFSTTDQELFKYIKYNGTDRPINDIRIGAEIFFEPNTLKKYIVKDIVIRHLVDDLEVLKYGIDMEDCTQQQGELKKWLFSILVKLEAKK
jgi:hypothetical protein